jgi:CBS domain-containing protein
MMRVEQLMTRQVKTCGPEDSLNRAAQIMWDNDCGCVPVCAGDRILHPIGIITDRDICMAAFFQGKPLAALRVADAMSKAVRSCRPEDSLTEAERIMREAKIRRLPVVDANGTLAGIITLADLAREADREQTTPKQTVTGDEVGVTLASIVTPPFSE